MTNIKTNSLVNLDAKLTPFPYQAEAFSAIKDLPYSAIMHEQGLGKTKIAIDLALYWLSQKNIDTVLIVTKKQLVMNWNNELKIHTYIKPRVLGTDKNKNYHILNSPARVIITNFEILISEKERIELFLKCRSVAIIVDESTKLKNPNAEITKVFFEMSDLFKIKVIMSGTPVANRPYDIWSQIYFLDKGLSLGEDFKEFKKETDLTNKLFSEFGARSEFESSVGSIFDKIRGFTVRETKKSSGLHLPNKNYHTVSAYFEEKQYKIYQEIINNLSVEVEKNDKTIIDNDEEALKRLLRLNQVASNPKLIDDSYDKISGKEEQLDVLINDVISRNEKCIIWSSYIENIEYFYKKYSDFHPRKIHGGMSIEERNKSVDVFKKDDTCRLLFATPQAAKEGLTLTVANNAIFYDRTFNLDDYLQAQDRIHRISQTKDCNIYIIMINNSIDKWIESLLSAKQYAAFLAQGDIDIETYRNNIDYSYGELIKEVLKENSEHGYRKNG